MVDKEKDGLLTDAEVDVANRRVEAGMSEEDAVASVKAERVGTAAAAGHGNSVPGGNIAPPSLNDPETRLAELYRQRDALLAEIAMVEQDLEVRRTGYGFAYPAPAATIPDDAADTADGDSEPGELSPDSTDEEIASAHAADLIALIDAHPEIAGRVRSIEQQRDKPRTTVLDAAGGAA